MKSNALFNTLFLAFSFAVIAIVSGNIQLTDAALSKTTNEAKKTEVVCEQEFASHTSMSKVVCKHKI